MHADERRSAFIRVHPRQKTGTLGAMRRLLLILLISSQQLLAQQTDDVVRVKTELVQTDITVVDKRGRFVSGLSANDFELRVDSQLQSLSFFEEVAAGSVDEEKQLTAARKGDTAAGKQRAIVDVLGVAVDDRGRFSSFTQKLDIPREVLAKDDGWIKWGQALSVPPGLYQVRVAVRDRQTGRTGSAMTWIEIL